MFKVADRRWKVHLEPSRAKGRWEDADSDSDYVYSGDEEETKEETKEEIEGVESVTHQGAGSAIGREAEGDISSPARKKVIGQF